MHKILISLAALFALLLPVTADAQYTLTCPDGSEHVVYTPFERPCKAVPEDEKEIPKDAVRVFGDPPVYEDFEAPLKFRKYQIAKDQYESDIKSFKEIVAPPAGAERAFSAYIDHGMGTPIFYKNNYGLQASFPNALFVQPTSVGGYVAAYYPAYVIGDYQESVVDKGIYVPNLLPWLRGNVSKKNEKNRQSAVGEKEE